MRKGEAGAQEQLEVNLLSFISASFCGSILFTFVREQLPSRNYMAAIAPETLRPHLHPKELLS